MWADTHAYIIRMIHAMAAIHSNRGNKTVLRAIGLLILTTDFGGFKLPMVQAKSDFKFWLIDWAGEERYTGCFADNRFTSRQTTKQCYKGS